MKSTFRLFSVPLSLGVKLWSGRMPNGRQPSKTVRSAFGTFSPKHGCRKCCTHSAICKRIWHHLRGGYSQQACERYRHTKSIHSQALSRAPPRNGPTWSAKRTIFVPLSAIRCETRLSVSLMDEKTCTWHYDVDIFTSDYSYCWDIIVTSITRWPERTSSRFG